MHPSCDKFLLASPQQSATVFSCSGYGVIVTCYVAAYVLLRDLLLSLYAAEPYHNYYCVASHYLSDEREFSMVLEMLGF